MRCKTHRPQRRASLGLLFAVLIVGGLAGGCDRAPSYLANLAPIPPVSTTPLDAASQDRIEEQRTALEQALKSARRSEEAVVDSQKRLAAAYGEFGRLMLAYGYPAVAVTSFSNAVILEPIFRWRYYRGVSLQLADQLDDARLELERAVELQPDDLATLIRLGRITVAQGDTQAGARWFGHAQRVAPESAAALLGLGRIASLSGRPAEAVELFERVLELQPSATSARYGLGLALRELGRLEEARVHMAISSGILPTFDDPLIESVSGLLADAAELRMAAGSAAAGEQDWQGAVAQFLRAVELAPEDPSARLKLATALGEAGQHRAAIEHFNTTIQLDPNNRDAHFNLGAALLRIGRPQAALDALTRAVELDPAETEARLRRAQVADSLGEEQLAEADFAELLRSSPAHPPLLLVWAERALRKGQLSEARERFEAAATSSPGELKAYLGLFQVARQQRDFRAAQGALERGLDQRPEDTQLTDLLARLLATCADDGVRDGVRAVALARRNQRIEPSLDHRETLAMAWAETGDFAEAIQQQSQLLKDAEARNQTGALARIRQYLALYQEGKPVRAQ